MIDRRFVRIATGLVHMRSVGELLGARESLEESRRESSNAPGWPRAVGTSLAAAAHGAEGDTAIPLFIAHSSPGSSLGLVPMLDSLGASRAVLAADRLGSGDSDAHAVAEPGIGDFADDTAALLDALHISRVDFYGQHTGAQIGIELALRHPSRVRRLVLDGVALFPADLLALMKLHYAPPMVPAVHGGHLAWAWNFVRELAIHFPHFMQDPAHRLHDRSVPPPEVLQRMVVDLLKALPTYHLAYRAAFAHPVAERLALVRHETLVMATVGDPLERYLDSAAEIVGQGPGLRAPFDGRTVVIRTFLDR